MLSEKEIITSSIEPPSPIQHLRRGAPFFNLPRGAKTPSSVCTPGVCHPGYATVTGTISFHFCKIMAIISNLQNEVSTKLTCFAMYAVKCLSYFGGSGELKTHVIEKTDALKFWFQR